MDYLTKWRVQTACELLEAGSQNISEIANAVGYESESAFSVAFRRVIKCRPGFYKKNLAIYYVLVSAIQPRTPSGVPFFEPNSIFNIKNLLQSVLQ